MNPPWTLSGGCADEASEGGGRATVQPAQCTYCCVNPSIKHSVGSVVLTSAGMPFVSAGSWIQPGGGPTEAGRRPGGGQASLR